MGVYLHSLSAVFMIFSLLAVGYVLGKLGWMTASDKRFVSRFVVNIAVPMNCITGILNNFTRSDLAGMGLLLPVPFITISMCLLISFLVGKSLHLPRRRFGVFVAMAFISNTLFIGLPLSTQLFGETASGYVMIYYIGSTVFTQTVCVMLVEHAGSAAGKRSPAALVKEIFTKPPIIGLVAAVTMLLLDVRPPEMFMSFAKYLSSTVSPLALMYCGYIVYELGLRSVNMEKGILSMLIIRLLISPLICTLVCILFGVQGLCRSVFIVLSALPTVSQITVMAGAYGADEKYSAAGAILSMMGIFITVPLLMVILT